MYIRFLYSLICMCAMVAWSCQPPKETGAASDTVATAPLPAETTDKIIQEAIESVPMTASHQGSTVTVKQGTRTVLSFTLPDSTASWDFEREASPYIAGQWKENTIYSYKSFSFSIDKGEYCSYPSDEGTSTMAVDTIHAERDFYHGRFDNLAAGAYGIEEMYDTILPGHCIRFNWTINWTFAATEKDKEAEFEKIATWLKTVHFEE